MLRSKKFLLSIICIGFYSLQSNANAFSLSANNQYVLTGQSLSVFDIENVGIYYIQFSQEGLVNTGNLVGGVFDTINIQSLISSTEAWVWDSISSSWNSIATPTLNGSSNAFYTNVSYNGNLGAAVQGIAGGIANVAVAGGLHNWNIVTGGAENMMQGFMDLTAPNPIGRWDAFDDLFSSNLLSMMIQPRGDDISAYIDTWIKGNGNLIMNNQAYNVNFYVDYHSTLSQIPEPATIGLLFSGILGGFVSRRRQTTLRV